MKNLKLVTIAIFVTSLIISCSNTETPEPVNAEELITTITITLSPADGGTSITMQSQDLDGDGPDEPVKTISGNLASGINYNGTITLLNETVTPAEDITEEVEEEDEDHQFFYTVGSGLNLTTAYDSFDSNGNALGTKFLITTGAASSGKFTFTLVHEPSKPTTNLDDAGGETDLTATFDITIE